MQVRIAHGNSLRLQGEQYLRFASLSRSHVCTVGMPSYLDGLPAYVYQLPCGHTFRTLARSAPDEETGAHWFWCQQCRTYAALTDQDLADYAETPPMHPSGMRMSDNQLTVRINAAIVKDRIAAYYRVHWDAVSIRQVAEVFGVNRDHVSAVALDLGVYQ